MSANLSVHPIDAPSREDILRQLSRIQRRNSNLSHVVLDWRDFNSRWWPLPILFKRRGELGRCINPEFVQSLSTISLEDEDIAIPLLRFAWRAIVSRCILLLLEPYSLTSRTFSGSGDPVASQSEPVVHHATGMTDTADGAHPANWRALRNRLMQGSHPGDIEKSLKALSKSITLLLFASINLPRQPRRPSSKKVQKACEEQVMQILKEVKVLAGMMQKGVLTRGYRPFHPPFEDIIGKEMNIEDSQDPLAYASGDKVLCVTQTGLIDEQGHCVTQAGLIDERGQTLGRPYVLTRATLQKISRATAQSSDQP